MEHYTDMVRRHILGDSEITRLSQEIYKRHKRALDLVCEHRPDPQKSIRNLLVDLIHKQEGLHYEMTTSGGRYIYFYPKEWDTDPHGFLGFVFHNVPGELFLSLETSWQEERARRRLFNIARNNESLFNHLVENTRRGVNPKLYRRYFLSPGRHKEAGDSEREEEIRKQWYDFLDKDLPRIEKAVREETWIWEVDATGNLKEHDK